MGFSVHSFDLVRWLVGSEARSVFAQIKRFGQHDIPDLSMMAHISFENGAMAQVWACLELPGTTFPNSQFRTQVVCEQGLLDFDGYTHLDMARDGKWDRVYTQPELDPMNPSDPVRLEAYINMVQEFIDAILEGKQPSVSGEEGRAAVAQCEAALQSSKTGQPVQLPL